MFFWSPSRTKLSFHEIWQRRTIFIFLVTNIIWLPLLHTLYCWAKLLTASVLRRWSPTTTTQGGFHLLWLTYITHNLALLKPVCVKENCTRALRCMFFGNEKNQCSSKLCYGQFYLVECTDSSKTCISSSHLLNKGAKMCKNVHLK